MNFHLFEQGSMAIVETQSMKIHGPYHDDDDVQADLYELERKGIAAIAIQIIGDNNL